MGITAATAAMLGAVVAVVAGTALAPAVLPPAHAAADEPGALAFEFGSLGRDAGEFTDIRDIAVGPNGRIVVADYGDGVEVFHPNGTFAFDIDGSYYRNVAVGPDGGIVACASVCDIFHPNGTFIVGFYMPRNSGSLNDVAVGPDGRIVLGTSGSRIGVFHPNGTLDFTFGELGQDAGEFGRGGVEGVGVDPNGFIFAHGNYWSSRDSHVWVFHPNGTFAGEFGHGRDVLYDVAFGPSGEVVLATNAPASTLRELAVFHPNGTSAFNVTYARDVAVGPTGMIVGTWEYKIRVFNGLGPADEWQPAWVFQPPPAASMPGAGVPYVPHAPAPSLTAVVPAFEFGSYGQGPGEFLAPHNIAFGPGGIIAVSDAENNRIQLFHPNGTFALEVGSRGSGPGEFAGPLGLTFGPNGLLAVSDVGNHRVQVFRVQ